MKAIHFFYSTILFYWVFAGTPTQAQTPPNLIEQLLKARPYWFGKVLKNPAKYEVQILYTQINRDKKNKPIYQDFSYRLKPEAYFNPASVVKLPLSLLALEKMHQTNLLGVDKFTRMGTKASYKCQKNVPGNLPNDQNYPCLARYVEQMMLVSDNDAYSRVFEYLGSQYIQQRLAQRGYPDMRIVRRFDDECDSVTNRHTNAVIFYNDQLEPIHYQPARYDPSPFRFPWGTLKKGRGYLKKGYLIRRPLDVTYSNYISLKDVHQLMKTVMFPEAAPPPYRFDLHWKDYRFLQKRLGSYPREGTLTRYRAPKYFDTHKKYLYYGRKKVRVNPNMRIFNIVGWWAGYLVDSAYIVDFKNGVEFFLSALIYTNENQVFDYKFEYTTVGFPFLARLGQTIYQHELKRAKPRKPTLNQFKYWK
ncbi:serine hydrolase [uncultured Microscilla sp.]|uniref:serine hydrolase n=1 Tax=uncultured Microscilla sp. TaxID=432653 RepID=UPI0026381AE4|nr:serine hydrolase [uncultured Microscilla sp.]